MKYSFKRIVLAFLVIILTSFVHHTVYATVYYASPSGVGTGTFASPCSFVTGLTKLTGAGDTLYLRGGIYYQSTKININKIGTASSRIAVMAYENEKPILDFSAEPYGSSNPGISINNTSAYLHIKGLVIRYAGDNGMINNGSNIIIENCEFYGNCDTGLQHKTGGNNLILNCDSHDNFDYESGGIATPDFGGNADGFADKQYSNVNPNTYDGCRSWNNSDDGWDFFQKIGSSIIKNSICYKNGPVTFDMTNHPRYLTDKAWFDQFASLATYTNYGNGNGFKLGGDFTAHNVTVIRCLAVGNRVRGFDQNNNYGTMTILNGSAYQNGYNYGFGNSSGGTLIIKNCVSLNSTNANAFNSRTVTNVNNSWNKPSVTVNSSDFNSLDTSLILSPRNADGSLATPFMNLVSGSDMIDAGIYVGIEYAGNFPDLGYYESGTIDKFPPIVTSKNTTQTVLFGNPIVTVTFSWGGGATGLDTANIPAGVTATFDNINKTLTLQGTPTIIGNNEYTVTSIGGADMPIVINGSIYVTSSSTKNVAFFTILPMSAADLVIYNKLSANPDFLVIPVDATSTTIDYSGFDVIVISPTPASTSAGFPALEAVNKPKLLLKPFVLRTTVWNWINVSSAINTPQSTVTIFDKTHPIFTGLTFTGVDENELQLFSTVTTNAVTGVTNTTWIASPPVTVIGNALGSATTNSVVEVPVGTNMNGTITTQRFVMIGVSEFSMANLTTTATQLIENTVYYLLGLDVPGGIVPVDFYSVNISENNGDAAVSWKVGIEININQYNVQRSSNGVDFTTIATVQSNGSNEYTWTDNSALSGKSFYRIIAKEISGRELLSKIVSLNRLSKNATIVIAPNPVANKKINLQLNNIVKGKVVVDLYNSTLQNVLSTSFDANGGNSVRSIQVPASCSPGIYNLRVIVANGQTYTKSVIIR
ncbi:right-handed parallel beta-helix repeat-containing protein [Ferruginibacter lapsinanis]|uniref:right-handed parallel beta-helix repeat-containing protein n=1 Tax=Ferruginibacter lapsinanis TaxID=563172 RepID=UPI001E433274|nr:T9SS type A sorting domain-containing protein [Ferruginibacter lapsinanis]UEG48834.1 right-handed parallel beta-helix repeat-containing protein [Ferruginibacter lapsinanis]